eukprot:1686807-Rhodomonas_salina.1
MSCWAVSWTCGRRRGSGRRRSRPTYSSGRRPSASACWRRCVGARDDAAGVDVERACDAMGSEHVG